MVRRSRREKHCKGMELRRWLSSATRRLYFDERHTWSRAQRGNIVRRITRRARAILAHGIATEIHCVPGHSGIPGNEVADSQVSLAQDGSRDTVIEQPYTSASNRARRISEVRSAAKAKWEADKCSKHFSYRPKGKKRTTRPILMTTVKSLASRIYRLKCGYARSGVYLKRFGHREDDKCWWYGGGGRTA